MELYFITDNRFHKDEEGNIYSGDMSFNHLLWNRYLKAFDKVFVIGRVFSEMEGISKEHIVDNVEVLPIFPFDGAISFLVNKNKVKRQLKKYLQKTSKAIIVRGAGTLCYLATTLCKKMDLSYGIEVIGDPYDVFAPGVVEHPLRIVFRKLFTVYQKEAVANASSVLYVTKKKLQERYPANKNAFCTYASNVQLISSDKVEPRKRPISDDINAIKLISIGTLEQMYKAPDIAIKSIFTLKKKGVKANLIWLGKGKYMDDMKELAIDLGVSSQVQFLGAVTSQEVLDYIDTSDIFLLLSRTEGLPRAMIEAMSRGIPCIGTNIGGIPELLDPYFLVPVDSPDSVSDKILYLLNKNEEYKKNSERNIAISQEYRPIHLEKRRIAFFESVKKSVKTNQL